MGSKLVDFETLSAKSPTAKALAKAFAQHGAPVVKTEVDAKPKRSAGMAYKGLHLMFADSQQVTFGIKQSGDVFQVKLNDKPLPIKEQGDLKQAVAEIVAYLEKGRSAFQKKLAKEKAVLPPGVRNTAAQREQQLVERRDALLEAVAAAEAAQQAKAKEQAVEGEEEAATQPAGEAVDTPQPITLTGKELGEFPDTPEGKKALRKTATTYLKSLIGTWVYCPALSGDVEIRTLGMKKVISLSGDPRKLKAIAGLRELIGSAALVSSRPSYLESETSVKAYHVLKSQLELGGEALLVRLIIREDNKGQYHYDHSILAQDVVLDSVSDGQEKSPDESEPFPTTTTCGGGANRSRFARCQLDTSIGQGGSRFNGGMVFNLFIEGEAPEVLEDPYAARIEALRTLPRAEYDPAIDALMAEMQADEVLEDYEDVLTEIDKSRLHELQAMVQQAIGAEA